MSESQAQPFDVVVAADLEGGIGIEGRIPWRLPSDLAHLVRVTTETRDPDKRNAVVMGRVTWDTLPPRYRPLPRRYNVVVSRQPDLALPDGVGLASSVVEGISLGYQPADVESVLVLGGGEIYRQALELPGCRDIYLTRVLDRFECDAFFPDLPPRFERAEVLAEGADDGLGFRIERWRRL